MMAYGKDHELARAPQWMRSMEEKYQRLHSRIVDQAALFSQSRNSVSVRLRELRQGRYYAQRSVQCKSSDCLKDTSTSHDITPTPDNSPERSMHVSSAVDFPKNKVQNQKSIPVDKIDTSQGDVHTNIGITNADGSGQQRPSSTLVSAAVPHTIDDKTPGDVEDASLLTPGQINSQLKDSEMNVSGDNKTELKIENKLVCQTPDKLQSDKSNVMEEQFGQNNTSCIGKADSQVKKLNRPYSVPRVNNPRLKLHAHQVEGSQTKITTETISKSSKRSSGPPVFNRKKNSKSATSLHARQQIDILSAPVFSSMSEEAQHAKHQTLKEMTSVDTPREGKHQTLKEITLVDTPREGTCKDCLLTGPATFQNGEQDNMMPSGECEGSMEGMSLKREIYNINTSSSGSSATVNDNKEHTEKHTACLRSRLKATATCVDLGNPSDDPQRIPPPNQSIYKKQQCSRLTQDHFLCHRSPLPAIRRVNDWSARQEDSFNITSPDFDVRFCETPAIPKDESEAPPEDIRRQSIEKCRLWLERQLGGP